MPSFIGPNGAGKSTLLKTIFALTSIGLKATILISPEKIITGMQDRPQLVPLGISMVPQSRNVFPTLTVDENLDVGTYAAPPSRQGQRCAKTCCHLFPDLRDKLETGGG